MLLQNKGFYKSFQFERHQYLGDPLNIIKILNDKIVDEVIIIDLDGAKSMGNYSFDWIHLEKVISESFSPVVFGGGILTIDDADKAFTLGVEKVVLQRGLFNKKLVHHIVKTYGAQSLIASIDVCERDDGYHVYDQVHKKSQLDMSVDQMLELAHIAGVGEILVTNISRDGQFLGLDQKMVQYLANRSDVPLIVAGGLSSKKCFTEAIRNGADAIAGAGIFTLLGPYNAVLVSYPGTLDGA